MTKLRDNFWLWGQNPGSHHHPPDNPYNLPGTNLMDSAAGGKFFGIPNCCRVAMTAGPEPPFDAEAEKLKDFLESASTGEGHLELSFAGLRYIDVCTLQMLISFKHSHGVTAKLLIFELSREVEEILAVCGLRTALLS